MLTIKNKEDNTSRLRWKYLYHLTSPSYSNLKKIGQKEYLYIKKYVANKKGKFLEIGCGMGACSLKVARNKNWTTYGIDYCFDNLIGAKKYWKYFKTKPNFRHGDINKMPYQDNYFDLLYGSGVLEHIYVTQNAVNEIFRVLKLGGISVNTVPAFSLSSLTFRQLSGTIPDLLILKQLFEFIHIKIFKRKFMHTGYEKCFTKNGLIKMYRKAGFKKIKIEHDNMFVPYLKGFSPYFKNMVIKLEKFKPFWAWYIITAQK